MGGERANPEELLKRIQAAEKQKEIDMVACALNVG